ncbi:hypothetical protein GDO78_005726 [Eleutherodactylus coqui]|uniref:Hepatocyte growth factor n=1 Tax=Eleutherodactylus coqui TaxID=57060 RepID=A0A8J6KDH4_ELECQ|nr:hypothetical protein GDO78_005726 [Eleutherodactylus coqui]
MNMWAAKLLLLSLFILCTVGRIRKRNSLHDYSKTPDTTLLRNNKELKMKTKFFNTTENCAKRCSRNKGLDFMCKAFAFDKNIKRCHWFSFNSLSTGIKKKLDHAFDLFEKKDYIRDCITGKGSNYKGLRNTTKSGHTCQSWNSMNPHEHSFLHSRYQSKDLSENYCRNPEGGEGGPWCFTKNPKVRYETCNIPLCSKVECVTCNGEHYRGPMDYTETGKECQRWDLQRPHKHKFRPERYPNKGLNDNYCRNPDGKARPWCYTLDPDTPWEFCAIKPCAHRVIDPTNITTDCVKSQGEGYRGTERTTYNGIVCQRWDSQFPHQHNFTPENYKCKDLSENYCRNPDGSEYPWCFTTDPNVRIGHCSQIPKCKASNHKDPGSCASIKMVRVVNGNPTLGKKGWMVSLRQRNGHKCGGSLVNEKWVLTASQCFLSGDVDLKDYEIWLGIHNIYSRTQQHKQVFNISQLVHGPKGSHLVLLKLSSSAVLNEHVALIKLPNYGCIIPEKTVCAVYGWGHTGTNNYDGQLHHGKMVIVGNEKCSEYHKGRITVNESEICAINETANIAPCERDYGGPLVCAENKTDMVQGVIIPGRGCAVQNRPIIFVRVAYYAKWIHKILLTYKSA